MSVTVTEVIAVRVDRRGHDEGAPPAVPLVREHDEARASFGMWLFIASEATLFLMLFFAYYYLAAAPGHRWLNEAPPALKYALPMLLVLLASSVVLYVGERFGKRGNEVAARVAGAGTLLLAGVFLVLSYFDYRDHLKTLLPQSNAYGSIFYTIVSVHLAHLLLGVTMIAYAIVMPTHRAGQRPPHKTLHNAALYWHFVDTVWVFIVALLYVVPHFRT